MTNDLPSVGTEDARTVSLPEYIFGGEAGEFEKVWDERTVRALVSERDELASRVRELEGERDAALADSERRHTLLKLQHAESVELYNALSDLSFECDGVFCVLPPSRETYNRTFMVLKMKPHLSPAALRGHGEAGAALASKEQP